MKLTPQVFAAASIVWAIYNRNAKFPFNIAAHFHQILGAGGNFFVDFLAEAIQIRITAIQQTDAHRDGTDIQMPLVDHIKGF